MEHPALSISSISLQDGSVLTPGALTVLVGPNNGGKSRFLQDISLACTEPNSPLVSITRVDTRPSNGWASLVDGLSEHARSDEHGHLILDSINIDMVDGRQARFKQEAIQQHISRAGDQAKSAVDQLLQMLGFHLVAFLRTDTRLRLVEPHINKNPNQKGPGSVVEAAYAAEDDTLQWISNRVFEAFGQRLHVDDSEFAQLRFVLNPEAELSENYRVRRDILAQLPNVDEQGDGIRSFVGILAAAKTTERPIVLIDEPEAFLHPPQAFLIGRAIAELSGRGHQIFMATHSADVLRGVLSQQADTSIVRLTRRDSKFRSDCLQTEILQGISNDPVLSSSRVLDGLFYEAVIVVESDGDVALYRRVVEQKDTRASIHFVNSYAKQISHKLAAPFRAMGVPCAIILDFDGVRIGDELRKTISALGGDWSELRDCHRRLIRAIEADDDPMARLNQVRSLMRKQLSNLESITDPDQSLILVRSALANIRDRASIWSRLKRQGRGGLKTDGRSAFDELDQQLRKLGVFIVPVGEREAWFGRQVPYSRNKSAWTGAALEHLATTRLTRNHRLRRFIDDVLKFCRLP